MKKAILTFIFAIFIGLNSILAQCAMCRTSVENNYSAGETSVAAGLNTGILYLFVMPYLMVLVIGYLWYRNSRKNAHQPTSST